MEREQAQTHQADVQFADVSGMAVAYRRAGAGPALVLLHGFGQDGRAWRPQLEGLADRFTVVAWDAPGSGASADPPAGYTFDEWADCLASLMDAIGLDRACMVGLSWGGVLAQVFWHRHRSRVRALVLADTYAGWRGSLPDPVPAERLAACERDSRLPTDAFVARYLPGMFGETASPDTRAELAAIMADAHPAGFRRMAAAVAAADTRPLLAGIDVPTMLVWGERDARSPLSVAHALRAAIPGSRLVILPRAGHVANLERPAEFNAAVRDFCLPDHSRGPVPRSASPGPAAGGGAS